MQRIYTKEYQSELNLNQTIVRMQKDAEGRPFVDVDESLAPYVTGVAETGDAADPTAATAMKLLEVLESSATQGVMDIRTQGMNSATARELAATITDPIELEALLMGERAHPQFDNGRVGVVAALENRIQELNARH